MEQIQVQRETTLSWFQSISQSMLYKVLDKVEHGYLSVKFGEHTRDFGDASSSLKADLCINDPVVFSHLITRGSIGVAEDFIAGYWSSSNLTNVIRFFVVNMETLDAVESKLGKLGKVARLDYLWKKLSFRNSETQAKKNILAHYDLGNHLYQRFLDPEMQYSSAIYPDFCAGLDEAQQFKMAAICQKLQLSADDNVIEIGTGWGGLAIYMAQHYGCHVTTTTISDAQHEYAEARIKRLGLEDKITLLKRDYRRLEGQFDKLVSIEMIEAVGHEYLDTFFEKCGQLLKANGLMLIQAITIADQRYEHYRNNVDFIQTYIFPGGCLPSITRMTNSITKGTDLVVHQLDDIGLHYAKTLSDWRQKFLQAWPELSHEGFDEKFRRLWVYYLCYCEGGFLERAISTVHLVARKPQHRS
ncbi:SAM-dependent methyltransferase [Alteromonas sp. a30]|uniref:SAM-dependent methyltransferase n=1 Tax=Alteromonas sp. a30 TaxID=2730917 RepID=UPI0022810DA3|nr:cyclopropane-fatty-acyl-phospholipid synthase family protein [Alteromonas sp. a30]MCY7295719.1 class I SAM-dependent methyltransferase [Alteromonas sp. a30]